MSRRRGKRETRRVANLWWALAVFVSVLTVRAAQGQVADDHDLTVIVFAHFLDRAGATPPLCPASPLDGTIMPVVRLMLIRPPDRILGVTLK